MLYGVFEKGCEWKLVFNGELRTGDFFCSDSSNKFQCTHLEVVGSTCVFRSKVLKTLETRMVIHVVRTTSKDNEVIAHICVSFSFLGKYKKLHLSSVVGSLRVSLSDRF